MVVNRAERVFSGKIEFLSAETSLPAWFVVAPLLSLLVSAADAVVVRTLSW